MRLETYMSESIKMPLLRSSDEAFWISPRSEVLQVKGTHIDTVIDHPEKFGYTREEIDKIYAKHGEKVPQEGKAREEIILSLVSKGWIRLRQYRIKGWSVNIGRMTKRIKDVLWDWANAVINNNRNIDKYEFVNIIGFQDSYNKRLTLSDIAKDALYESGETFDKENAIVIVESAKEFTWKSSAVSGQSTTQKTQ